MRAFLVMAIFSLLAFYAYAPIGTMDGSFNSDSAIPVIMANSESLSPYHLYYFGQDRFGGLAFALQWMIAKTIQIPWAAHYMFVFSLLFLSLALYALAVILGELGSLFVLTLSLGLLIHPLLRQYFFEINNPYALQMALCFFFWACLRRVLHSELGPSVLGYLTLYLIAFAAIWTSPASVVFCVVIAFLELFRRLGSVKNPRQIFSRVTACVLATVVLGFVSELAVRSFYHHYVYDHYAYELAHMSFSVKTPTSILWTRLVENFFKYLLAWWQAFPGEILLHSLAMLYAVKMWLRADRDPKSSWFTVLALYAVAWLGWVTISGVDWILRHNYNLRYATASVFILQGVSLLTITRAVHFYLLVKRGPRTAVLIVCLLAAISSFWWPHRLLERADRYYRLWQSAQQLSLGDGKSLVIGAYFDSYLWQGLAPDKIIALPRQGDSLRIPKTYKLLSSQSHLLACRDIALDQYGYHYQVQQEAWLETPHCRLSLLSRSQRSK